jgi:membrane-associated phospholipid phosphatase
MTNLPSKLITPSAIETIVFGSRSDVMSRRQMMSAAIAMMCVAGSAAQAATSSTSLTDPVLYWNNQLLSSIRDSRTPPPPASRVMAMMHTAVFDAVNAASGNQYQSYTLTTNAYGDADSQVAAAVAAHRVLVQAFPSQVATLDAALSNFLSTGTNSPAAVRGAELGKASADAIIAARATDGAFNSFAYTYGNQPGAYQNTSGNANPPAFQQWSDQKSWTLTSKDQFRPDAPPAVDSEMYAAAYNEVKALGSATSTERTADQTAIALYWADGSGSATPPGHWLQIAQNIALEKGNSTVENARLFALMSVAVADAAIVAWDAKSEYNFWRPITGIQNGATDGNDATDGDTAWTPLIATPGFQSYVSGHSTFSAAASQILTDFYGTDAMNFCSKQELDSTISRCFKSFSQAADEAGVSRIYGGIHWQFDNVAGLEAGRALAKNIFGTYFGAVPEPTTMSLFGIGVGAAAWRRRRKTA